MDRKISDDTKRRRRNRRIIITAASIAAVATAVVIITHSLAGSISEQQLRIAPAQRGSLETSVNGAGSVEPAYEEIINSPLSTRILEVYAKAGDTVAVGTALLGLDRLSAEAQLRSAVDRLNMLRGEMHQLELGQRTELSALEMQIRAKEMAVDLLRETVVNERRLDSIGTGTGNRVREAELAFNTGSLELEQMRARLGNQRLINSSALDNKRLELSVAENQLDELQRTFDNAAIKSPVRGTLTYINTHVGQQLSAGECVARVADLTRFKVAAQIGDGSASRLTAGGRVNVRVGRETLGGTIVNTEPLASNGSVSFEVRLDDDTNPQLRPGLKVEVYVMGEIRPDAVIIPTGPYYRGAGMTDLWVVEPDGSAIAKRRVKLGASNYDYVEVVDGVSPGERVVTSSMADITATRLKLK